MGVAVGAISAAVLQAPVRYVAVPGDLLSLITLPDANSLVSAQDGAVIFAGVALAFVASAETLLCASAVSRMHNHGRTDYDRELTAHGVANTLCGLVGTLPITGVISRSTANVESGASTRWSAVMHATWIALFVILLPDALALVPTSSLAAILIYIGFKLINVKAVRELASYGWPVVAIFVSTCVGIVAIDLLKGIIIGLVLSGLKLMYQMSHVHFELERNGERVELHLHGSATFLGLPKLQEVLDDVEPGTELHVHFDELEFIDHACLDLLNGFRSRHEESGGELIVEWDELMEKRQKRSRQAAAVSALAAVEATGVEAAARGAVRSRGQVARSGRANAKSIARDQ